MSLAVVPITTSCGGDDGKLDCFAQHGDEVQSTTSSTKAGASTEQTIDDYLITYSILPGSRVGLVATRVGDGQWMMGSEGGLQVRGSFQTDEREVSFGCG